MFDILVWIVPGILLGAVVGWVGCQCWSGASQRPSLDASAEQETTDLDGQERIDQIANKIRTLTVSVAADVSDHQSRVAEITSELQASGAATSVKSIVEMVADLVVANQNMQQRLGDTQMRLKEQTSQLQSTRQLANTDALTGLANRRMLDSQLQSVVDSQSHSAATLVLVDIDFFKSVNDRYGHQTGDAVLRRVAELMEVGLNDFGLCARYGGEEFAMFASTDDWQRIAEAVEDFRARLTRSRIVAEDSERVISVSCGVAVHARGETLAAWVDRADKALYAAKKNGRNHVRLNHEDKITRFSPSAPVEITITKNASEHPYLATEENPKSRRQCLVSQMRTMADNIDLNHVNLAAVAIRLPTYSLNPQQRETLLGESRRLMRSVDKIEFDDESTLLSLLVTSDSRKAEERAEMLLDQINHTLESFKLVDQPDQTATLGISMYSIDSTADEAIRQAVSRASV